MMGNPAASFRFHRSTPSGEGGLAVFELYDDTAVEALRAIFRPRVGGLPDFGSVRLGDLRSCGGLSFDEAIVARIPAQSSWNRLAAWTLSLHGGLWLQRRVAELLLALGGAEVSRRDLFVDAVRLGRLDGIRAAAYEFLLEARTEKAARFFARQYGGELSSVLRDGLSLCERGRLDGARQLLDSLVLASGSALRLGHPCRLLIAGRPNSGKSTLFNRLLEDERTAVTDLPGTTRDLIEGEFALKGFPVTLIDSAGIREPEEANEIEREGIRGVHAVDVDGVILLVPYPWDETASDREIRGAFGAQRCLVVNSLADLDDGTVVGSGELRLSCLAEPGVDSLRSAIARRWLGASGLQEDVPCAPFMTGMTSRLRVALEAVGSPSTMLDVLRGAIVESLAESWFETVST